MTDSTDAANLEELRERARSITPELATADAFTTDVYRVGYIRFEPSTSEDAKMVAHQDLDVVCLVLSGRGRLRRGAEVIELHAGDVYRIPVGSAHDFSASSEPLEMFYSTIKMR